MHTIVQECWQLALIALAVMLIAFLEIKRLDHAQTFNADQNTSLTYISWQVVALLFIVTLLFIMFWRD